MNPWFRSVRGAGTGLGGRRLRRGNGVGGPGAELRGGGKAQNECRRVLPTSRMGAGILVVTPCFLPVQ